jgi:hypothetical protein
VATTFDMTGLGKHRLAERGEQLPGEPALLELG